MLNQWICRIHVSIQVPKQMPETYTTATKWHSDHTEETRKQRHDVTGCASQYMWLSNKASDNTLVFNTFIVLYFVIII